MQMQLSPGGKVQFSSLAGPGRAYLTVGADGSLQRLIDPRLDSLFDCTVKLWKANGNYLTPDCFLGSTNQMPLRMFTHNAERMRISASGAVGIGTPAPAALLHMYAAGGPAILRLETGNPLAESGLEFWAGSFGNSGAAHLGQIRGQFDATHTRSELKFGVNAGQNATSVVEVLRLAADEVEFSTRLGIGMQPNPQDQLSVAGAGRFHAIGSTAEFVRIAHDGTNASILLGHSSPVTDTTGRLLLNPGSNSRTECGGDLIIAQHLGIGTDQFNDGNRQFQLSVSGGLRAVYARVYPSWADHVFVEGYPLRSLAQVETFITAHGHLPGIPAAAEVAENGIDVGATQALLLEKIEELTLYMIRLEKENRNLIQRIELIESENE